jgi:hypothetical protein
VISLRKVDFETFKADLENFEKLFLLFLDRLPPIYQNNAKTIPFVIAELTLCNHKIKREDAKRLLKELVKKEFLKVVKFKGYRINYTKVVELLNRRSICDFAGNFGLNFVTSPFFQQLIYHKLGEKNE